MIVFILASKEQTESKISATVRDSLQYRLKREGYVEGVEVKDKSLYSITPKGKKLLEGWIAFLSVYS